MRKSDTGGHANEVETGNLLAARPDLMKMDTVNDEPREDMNRLNLPDIYTGIWWYAKYPNYYAGESSGATAEMGELKLAQWSAQLAEVVRTVKNDNAALKLQNEFFRENTRPLETPVR